MSKKHWENDRNYELMQEFAVEGEMIGDAMAMWLELGENTRYNNDHMLTTFMLLSQQTREDILTKYIEETGQEYEFDQWYADKYALYVDDDDNDDDDGDFDDNKYEVARDLSMDFRGLFDTMGLDGEGVQQAWDRMIARGC